MAIEGLKTVAQPNQVNFSDQVGASVEALDLLGLVEDHDKVTESVTADYNALTKSGRAGEAFIQLPRDVITLGGMVRVLDDTPYTGDRKYPTTYVYDELWTPGVGSEGYQVAELDNLTLGGNGNFATHARLAVHNPANEQEPLLHLLDMPFDGKYAKRKQQTQLEAIDVAVNAYEAEGHEGFAMTPLNAKAVAFIALTRRIKGEAMPMAWGFMRDATLPRKTVGGRSVVGDVDSVDGQLYLYGSDGDAYSYGGVGLSVGPKEIKS